MNLIDVLVPVASFAIGAILGYRVGAEPLPDYEYATEDDEDDEDATSNADQNGVDR
jgi:hypothetical protein